MPVVSAVLVAVASLLLASSVEAVDVTTCGQVVPRGEVGVLQADLTCPVPAGVCTNDPTIVCNDSPECGHPSAICDIPGSVNLERRATLDLNGHVLKGGRFVVRCQRRCLIMGPGSVVEGDAPSETSAGIYGSRTTVTDAHVVGGRWGIKDASTLTLTNVSVSGADLGVFAPKVRATNVDVSGNAIYGFQVLRKMDALGVTASNNGQEGITTGGKGATLKGSDLTANGNGVAGIAMKKIVATSVTANDNGTLGLLMLRNGKITGLTATGNGEVGVEGHRGLKLEDSTVTGHPVVDLLTGRAPRLQNTTCDTSQDAETGEPWGVCSGD